MTRTKRHLRTCRIFSGSGSFGSGKSPEARRRPAIYPFAPRRAATLLELLIAMTLLTITGLWVASSFGYINRSLQGSRMKTLAINLTQEQIESLKDKTYFSIIPTSSITYNSDFNPAVPYDAEYYPPEDISISGKKFTRYTYIERIMNSSSTLVGIPYDSLDTGLKRIIVTTVWKIGQTWYKYSASNVSANYSQVSNGGFNGVVSDAGGNPIPDANIYTGGDAFNNDYTDTGGLYAFAVTPGSYALTATAAGYFKSVSTTTYDIDPGTLVSENFTLTAMSSGSVSGAVYVNNHLVISQLVGSSVTTTGDTEWVEVFNPTTWTWTMATGLGTGANEVVHFYYKESAEIGVTPDINYRAVAVAPNSYFLFANTGTIVAAGVTRTADAVYSDDIDFSDIDDVIGTGNPSAGGYVSLRRASMGGEEYDKVGWNATGNGNAAKKLAESFEGVAIDQSIGFEIGEEYTRKTTAGGIVSGQGRCYDAQNNDYDFVETNPIVNAPRNSADTQTCVTGTPAIGAIVTADDGLSSSTTAWRTSGVVYATFTLVGIATGTWTVQVTSGTATLSVSSVSVLTQGVAVGIPNATTIPVWTGGQNYILLTTATTNGVINGRVTNANGSGVANIKISGEPDGNATTNSGGYYSMPMPQGTYSVTANPGAYTPSYTTESRSAVVVSVGQINSGNDFVLSGAGRISGYVCNANVANAYPSATVTAVDSNDNVRAEILSGSNGKFTLLNLSTGTYIIAPVLDTMQSASPVSISVGVLAGQNVFAGTFTVLGAYGTIKGTATAGGAPINTGALIIATTGTITALTPPTVSSAILSGTPYYMASSLADGTYAIQVRTSTASATFTLYGWYTTYAGETSSTTKKAVTGVNVTGGQTRYQSISW